MLSDRIWRTVRRAHAGQLAAVLLLAGLASAQGRNRLLGWNDLGMHCMDGDTSIFSILPPYNNVHAQLIVNNQLVTTGSGYTITYEGVADANGSINTTSIGKTDFWQHVQALFGVSPALDEGLAGFRMPGAQNTPQPMSFDSAIDDWYAQGIPLTPIDDQQHMNPYPLFKLVARNASNQVVAETTPVLPVSSEMRCVLCHGSGANPQAMPRGGWLYGAPATDDRVNILKLHDDRFGGTALYTGALNAVGYSAAGLYDTAVVQGTPVLCANCHGTNALGMAGLPYVPKLTRSMHQFHANVRLPDGRRLDDIPDRAACYACHPGQSTKCMRGAMGKAINADGQHLIACQDCHGNMAAIGAPARQGWLDEPNCQACHTGDAVTNAGAIRFENAFDQTTGLLRTTTNDRFATTPDVPQAGSSLYRFSTGHGGLECSACHGSTHAIFPTTEANDNVQSITVQGHEGTIVECSACHSSVSNRTMSGPHGMHPVGSAFINSHGDVAEHNRAQCRVCHGTDYRGTVLSQVSDSRSVSSRYGSRQWWRRYQVGCYECHNGPNSENSSNNSAPQVQNLTRSTPTDTPLSMTLSGTDANNDPLTLRIVEQPKHGAVAFDGTTAVYTAWDGYQGTDAFTYAASDNKRESNLGTVTVNVQGPACTGTVTQFGFGCPLPDQSVPTIRVEGCPTARQQIDVVVDDNPASAGFGVMVVGLSEATTSLGTDGCMLRIGHQLGTTNVLPITNGRFTMSARLPQKVHFEATVQGFAFTTEAPRGYIASPGVHIVVQ